MPMTEGAMRNHLLAFAACTVLLAWSGLANAERTFGGFECTIDCSGHARGYRWAERIEITESSECPLGGSRALRGVLPTRRTLTAERTRTTRAI
jgi:hypothetical protein